MTLFLQQLLNGISLGCIYALISVGYALIYSILRFSNFSHGVVMCISAYVAYFAFEKWNLGLVGVLLVGLMTGLLMGMLMELMGFRIIRKKKQPAIYFIISSITLLMLFNNIITIRYGSTFYTFPQFLSPSIVKIGDFIIPKITLIVFAVTVIALFGLMLVLNRTKIGIAIRAAACDQTAVKLMGCSVDSIIVATFAVSGLIGGICGVFLGIKYTVYPQLGELVIKAFVASVIGGLGSLSGAVIGGIILGIIEVGISITIGSGWTSTACFVIIILFLLIRPQGIAGFKIKDRA